MRSNAAAACRCGAPLIKKRGWPFGHPQMLFGDYDVVDVVAMLPACFEVALKTFLTANLDNSGSIHILNDKT